MSKARRSFTAEQKAEVVCRHLKDKVAVGDLSVELGIQPSQIHKWVASALAQVERVFQGKSGLKGKSSQPRLDKAKERQIKLLAWSYYEAPRQSDPEMEQARMREVLALAPDTLDFWELRGLKTRLRLRPRSRPIQAGR